MATQTYFPHPVAFDLALQEPVFHMIRRGLRVDMEVRDQLSAEYHDKLTKIETGLRGICGTTFNAGSHVQVKKWLYDELKLPPKYKTNPTTKKKGLSSDEDALRSLLAHCEEEMQSSRTEARRNRFNLAYLSIRLILTHRGVAKALSSYIDGPKDGALIDPDGRVRSLIVVGKVETARFSANKTLWNTGCNLMTIPRKLRCMYIADEGKELAEFDLNRGESWVYAHLADDPEMMRIHQTFGDFHSETAVAISSVFGARVTSLEGFKALKKESYDLWYKLRFLGKKVNHASAYRMGPFRGAEVVNEEADDTGITVTVGQMRRAQQAWKDKYFNMPEWWNRIERQLDQDRILVTPYGRRRVFYGFWGDHLFKEATAYVPQSTSVDYLNLGMLRVWHELHKKGLCELLHQNHDSILVQYDKGRRDEVIPEVIKRLESRLMVNGHDITIPVEGSYGNSWMDPTEWKAAA